MTNEEIKSYIGKAIYHIDEAVSALGGIEGLDATIQNLWDVATLLEFVYEEHEGK